MSAIDQAKKHFASREVKEIVVPEWGDESGPLVIYADPVTLRTKNRIKSRIDKEGLEGLAYALIITAKDKAGEPIFTIKDKHELINRVDSDVMARVMGEIMTSDEITEKN